MKKGSIFDHALLMASMFRSVEDENRVFVCLGAIGTLKHAWVMTLSADFKEITFWDP